jgi:hypothetical protein
MHSSLLATVAIILFQSGEMYSNLDLTNVKWQTTPEQHTLKQ